MPSSAPGFPPGLTIGLYVALGLVGLLVGSFLNVVIARVPEGLSIVSPRSRCPKCGHAITWYENVPVVSWLVLRGRCSGCRAPISLRYPAIELLTGGLFALSYWRFGFAYPLLLAVVLVGLLVPLTFIDLEHWILPFSITVPGIALGLVLSIPLGLPGLIDSAIGAGLGFVVFWALEIVGEKIFKKEALGGGDKYLLALIGAFLTWRPLLGVIFLSSLQGGVIGSVLLLFRGRAGPAPLEDADGETRPVTENRSADRGIQAQHDIVSEDEADDWEPGATNIPFGPWLSIAALELLFFSPWLAQLPGAFGFMLTGR